MCLERVWQSARVISDVLTLDGCQSARTSALRRGSHEISVKQRSVWEGGRG